MFQKYVSLKRLFLVFYFFDTITRVLYAPILKTVEAEILPKKLLKIIRKKVAN